ncbi:MAG: STAS domain-containing protein [Caulobacteraceae bacterium]
MGLDMAIAVEELADDITFVRLSGRIDVAGAVAIEMPMNVVGGSRSWVVVDLSEVEFMASLGLRCVVQCAKAVQARGGKLALLAPRPIVAEVITTSGIDELVPVYELRADALAAVSPN